MTRLLSAVANGMPLSKLYGSSVEMSPDRVRIELLAGLTVALALVPEAVAFAFVAGVHPLVGLYAAFIVGLITAVFGGRPGMISGATGALAVVMVSLVATHGVEYLFATVVLMGLIQIGAGIFRLGKFIRMVPHPVMLGFVNGLAIVIFLAQLTQFQVPGTAEVSGHGMAGGEWLSGTPLAIMLVLVVATMAIIWGMPKLTTKIPAPLAWIAIIAVIVIAFDLPVPRVGDMASIQGGLPLFHIPSVPLNWETFEIILPYALILAA
ncbi:MAG: SulP family inorganic anion transporter, partial [Pseudomonadota bacterium]